MLLLSVSPLGQAGVKRLHPNLRRIRRHEVCSGAFASLNRNDYDPYSVFLSPAFLKRRQLRNPGLPSEPMHLREKFNSHRLAASRGGMCAVSTAVSFTEAPKAGPLCATTFEKVIDHGPAPHFFAVPELCFSHVARQPQEPVVQAHKKV